MKHFKYILFTMVFFVSTYYSKSQWPPTDPAYTITFGDEFNDTTGYMGNNVDPNKWVPWSPWNNGSTKTHLTNPYDNAKSDTLDLAGYNFNTYDTSNVHVIPGSPGVCRLIARKGAFNSNYWTFPSCPSSTCTSANAPCVGSACFVPVSATYKYSNGSLHSKRLLRYGYYEIKFRLPALSGPDTAHNFKPTCWLFNSEYPRSPVKAGHNEIDIFEIGMSESGYDFTNSLYYSYKYKQNDTLDIKIHNHHIPNVNMSSNVWHTASVFWDKDSITFYFDGVITNTPLKNLQSINQNYQWHGDSLWPMSVFIEAYIPNDFTYYGAHQPRPQRADTSQTPFPFVYEIDYYNVWQLKTACDTNKTYLTTNLTSFNSKLYKSLTLGGSGGNVDFTGSGKASALGVDYVLLDEGTAIGNTVEFYAQMLKCPDNVSIYSSKTAAPPPVNSAYRREQQ
jgi:hypothetical protein